MYLYIFCPYNESHCGPVLFWAPSTFIIWTESVRWWWSILLLAVLGMRGRRGQGKCWRDVATAGHLSLLMISPVDGSGVLQRYRRLDIIQRAEQRQESVSVGFLHRSEINSAVGRCPWSRISEMQTPTLIRDVLLKDDVFPFPVGIILVWMRMNDEQQEYQSMSRALSHTACCPGQLFLSPLPVTGVTELDLWSQGLQ